MEDYLAAKLRIFANQGNDDVAVYNGCDPALRGRDLGGCARRVAFCRDCEGEDCQVVLDGAAIVTAGSPLVGLDELAIRGPGGCHRVLGVVRAGIASSSRPTSA